jgi:hypothetical protein
MVQLKRQGKAIFNHRGTEAQRHRKRIGNFKIQHPNFKEASKSKLQPEAVGTEFPKFEI